AALVLLVALALNSRQATVYESQATVAFLPSVEAAETQVFFLSAIDSLLPTYGEKVESRSFLDDVASTVPGIDDGGDLTVSAVPETGTGILRITARDEDPGTARDVADAATDAFVADVNANSLFDIEVIDQARVPESPVSPSTALVAGATLLLAVLAGVLAALAWERLLGRVSSTRELRDASDAPVIGSVPDENILHDHRLIVIGSESPELHRLEESYRAVANNVLFASSDRPNEALMVTGINPGDGKSTTAANLAVAMSELGTSVLLVDADLRRPVQHEMFDVPNDTGLSSTVLEGADPATLVRRTRFDGVYLVPAGPPVQSRAQELRVYIDELAAFSSMADVVLLDSPPLSAADDVRLLAAGSGGVVVLVRAGRTGATAVGRATDALSQLGANVLGTVLTRATDPGDVDDASTYYGYRPGRRLEEASRGVS
ncbi:MAG: polysaccharide biosynthesis tyrosine autokinase, partial [Actinomycetota bacterium]